MPIHSADLLDLIESRGIMSPDLVDDLREQVAAAGREVHAVHIARKLVEAGYLNPYFAKTLLEELSRKNRAGRCAEEDELDLAPLEEEARGMAWAEMSGTAWEFDIELAPIRPPDAWPTVDEKISLLPAANPQSAFGALAAIPHADHRHREHRHDAHALWPWVLGALVAILLFAAIVLLMR